MFSLRNKKNYLWIILNIPSYLELWLAVLLDCCIIELWSLITRIFVFKTRLELDRKTLLHLPQETWNFLVLLSYAFYYVLWIFQHLVWYFDLEISTWYDTSIRWRYCGNMYSKQGREQWIWQSQNFHFQFCVLPMIGQKKVTNFSLCFVYFQVSPL